jgi:hypothetical protein
MAPLDPKDRLYLASALAISLCQTMLTSAIWARM